MRLFDTATRDVRPFAPPRDPVSLYVCGITPYDAAHLGHAFTYHVFDVVTRRLLSEGRRVRSVRNVTDCDDDIFRVARERGIDHRVLVREQVERFDREMAAIGILDVDAVPYASQHVPAMIDWISRLEAAGNAYAVDGWVYFAASSFAGYGGLSRLDREAMLHLGRQRGADPDDPRKRDPLDFVLWQPSLPDEMVWDAPWSRGRPGWHIECSVLVADQLGVPVDLHGGGDDLVFPHHECEIAQAEAVTPAPFAKHWMHVAMVGLDGVKMSKSLGNLVFVHDLLRDAPPPAARLVLAAHHWRQAWSYDPEELAAARSRAERYAEARLHRVDPAALAESEAAFFARIDDDLDTPGALRVLDDLAAAALREPAARPGDTAAGPLLRRLAGVIGADLDAMPEPAGRSR